MTIFILYIAYGTYSWSYLSEDQHVYQRKANWDRICIVILQHLRTCKNLTTNS